MTIIAERALHNNMLSGNSYKVRLLLKQLRHPYEDVKVDIFKGESRTPEFLAMNPAGQTPLLELDDGTLLPESNAILWHLADGSEFLPRRPIERAEVLRWMLFEQNALMPHVGWARFITRWILRFTVMHTAAEGGFDLSRYPAIGAWMKRVRAEPGHVPLEQL